MAHIWFHGVQNVGNIFKKNFKLHIFSHTIYFGLRELQLIWILDQIMGCILVSVQIFERHQRDEGWLEDRCLGSWSLVILGHSQFYLDRIKEPFKNSKVKPLNPFFVLDSQTTFLLSVICQNEILKLFVTVWPTSHFSFCSCSPLLSCPSLRPLFIQRPLIVDKSSFQRRKKKSIGFF